MGTRNMLSVGIDVGTTTTQLVLSDLAINNQHRLGLVPRLDIDTREVRYQGDAHFTPLRAADEVDVDKLTALIRHEYTLAGVDPGEVETGAVIITGETARTRNAEQILHGLGDLAEPRVADRGPGLGRGAVVGRQLRVGGQRRHRRRLVERGAVPLGQAHRLGGVDGRR
jgi:ethanolamine utilization protein EutA